MRVIVGAVEQAKMEGINEITYPDDLVGTDKYIKVEPKCPADKNSESYDITIEADGSYTVTCPNKVEGHVLSGAEE